MAKIHLERVPIFGQVEIGLKNESNETFESFYEDIERLKGINQLGILHEFLNIPPYRRYDYIMMFLYLIEKATQYNSKFNFHNTLKLDGQIRFSSSEEFLKCWALLYSIGHLEMTFASEHAFMRYILNNKDEFIEFVSSELELELNSDEEDENEIKSHDQQIYEEIKYLIEEENYMELYKIFTLLKIKKKNLNRSEIFSSKIWELAKIMVLKYRYLQNLDIDRSNKLLKLINYFEIIRKLTFTVLDGSISQNKLNLNYYVVFEDLDSFMDDKNYQNILNDINKFYTSDIFNSAESAYYHHRCVFDIQKIFDNFELEDLCNKIILTESELKSLIDKSVNDIKTELDRKNHTKDDDLTNKVFIQSELTDHIRITLPIHKLEHPIKEEINSFKLNKTFGGLLYNQVTRKYDIDIYPNSEKSDKRAIIYHVLNSINEFYEKSKDNEGIGLTFVNLVNLYKKAKKENIEILNDEIKELENFEDFLSILGSRDVSEHIFSKNFKDLVIYLFNDTIKSKVKFSSWELSDLNVNFPILFKKSEIESVIDILSTAKNVKKLELSNSLEILSSELKNGNDNDNDIFYVFSPNTYFLSSKNIQQTEIDFLLIKFMPSEKKRILKIGEVKPNSKFRKDQCIKQLQRAFNIPISSAKALYEGVSDESQNKPIKITLDGNKSNEIIIFEKSESL